MNKIPFTYVVTELHICAVHIRTYFVQHKTKTQHNTTTTKKETELLNTRKTVQSHKSGCGAKLSLRFLGRQDSLQAHIYVCGTVNWPLYIRSSTFNLFSQNQSGGKTHGFVHKHNGRHIYIFVYTKQFKSDGDQRLARRTIHWFVFRNIYGRIQRMC